MKEISEPRNRLITRKQMQEFTSSKSRFLAEFTIVDTRHRLAHFGTFVCIVVFQLCFVENYNYSHHLMRWELELVHKETR